MPNEYNEEREYIAIEAWEKAVKHAEKAQKLRKEIQILKIQVENQIEKEKLYATLWLTVGGYGDDAIAHKTLELPFWINKE